MAKVWPGFHALSGGADWVRGSSLRGPLHHFGGIDACLGLEGLPQSGTGQATLFTGVNCAALAGRHYGPYPHSATRQTIREHSVFQRFGHIGVAFANAYPQRFFEWVNRTGRWPTTTRACLDADVHIRTIEDLEEGRGIAADVTGAGLANQLGLPVTVVPPETAGDRLLSIASSHGFTLMEVFQTDKAGHARSRDMAQSILEPLDALFSHLAAVRPPELTIVLTSDHGNLEDLSVKTHTRNEVPLAVLGPGAPHFRAVKDLAGVVPAMEAVLTGVVAR
ncbi:MAG: 2,3-bisphosphoglycerate-independent phosphoglycerate mutase [Rhodothermales bacterium]|jgi:2,3-bisphosphoglycerate-independent phosphoglycerate mutase